MNIWPKSKIWNNNLEYKGAPVWYITKTTYLYIGTAGSVTYCTPFGNNELKYANTHNSRICLGCNEKPLRPSTTELTVFNSYFNSFLASSFTKIACDETVLWLSGLVKFLFLDWLSICTTIVGLTRVMTLAANGRPKPRTKPM